MIATLRPRAECSIAWATLAGRPGATVARELARSLPAWREQHARASIAHAGDRAVAACSEGFAVGVDVEPITPAPPRAELEALLAPSELEALDRLEPARRATGFACLWTRKEAVLKALGAGLALPADRVVVSDPDEPPALLSLPRAAPPIELAELDVGAGHIAHVAAVTSRPLTALVASR